MITFTFANSREGEMKTDAKILVICGMCHKPKDYNEVPCLSCVDIAKAKAHISHKDNK